MKLFLAFSGEGTTDHRFIPTITEKLIKNYYLEHAIPIEFSWIKIPRKGTSYENILQACSIAKDQHVVLFHRDSGNNSWNNAFDNHFQKAITYINSDKKKMYNKNIIPIIPVKEIEAWMLANKGLLIGKLETTLSENNLGLTYRLNRIENIGNPKSVIEQAVTNHHNSLPKKQRRYAVSVGDLYDLVAADINLDDLEVLDSYNKFKEILYSTLDSIEI